MSDCKSYLKFNPEKHLIFDYNPRKNNYKFDIRKSNIFSSECNCYLEPVSKNCFPIFTPECIEIFKNEINSWLLRKDSCNNLRPIDKNNKPTFLNFESPTLRNCTSILPFIYDAFTHSETIKLLGIHLGFELDSVLDYEIAHFAKKLDQNSKSFIEKLGLGISSKVIIRKKTVAYPYVCIIKLNPKDICDFLPAGYGIFLRGRLIENLAGKIIFNNNTNNEIILCPSYVPKQINQYEDYKDLIKKKLKNGKKSQIITKNKITNIKKATKGKSFDNTSYDFEKIEKYKLWLNRYYMGNDHRCD